MSVFPGAIDDISPAGKSNATAMIDDHPNHHNLLAEAIENIERELGVNPSGAFSDVAARFAGLTSLPADTVVAAGTRIIANKLLAGDTQPAWRVFGDGRMEWGPGGSTAPDTFLSRAVGGMLTLSAPAGWGPSVAVNHTGSGDFGEFKFQINGTTRISFGHENGVGSDRFYIYDYAAAAYPMAIPAGSGRVTFGSTASPLGQIDVRPVTAATIGIAIKAAASQSANLLEVYDSAGTLNMAINNSGSILSRYAFAAIDGSASFSFSAGGVVLITQAGLVPGLRLNTAGAGLDLKMPSGARAILTLANSGRFQLGASGALNPGLDFGIAGDTVLYRSAADELKTDDNLIVAGGLALGAQTPGAAGSLKFGDGTLQSTAAISNPMETASVYRNNDYSPGTDGLVAIPFEGVSWQSSSIWDSATALYFPVSGKYLVEGYAFIGGTSQPNATLYLLYNGNMVERDANSGMGNAVKAILNAAAGQYVQLAGVNHGGANPWTAVGTARLSIHRLS